VGHYNRSKIVVDRGQVEQWLSAQKVLEYKWNSPEVRDLVKHSKFAKMAEFMKQTYGYIVFRHTDETVWYRRIRIRRL